MKSIYFVLIFGAVSVLAESNSNSEEDNGFFMGGKDFGKFWNSNNMFSPLFKKNPFSDVSEVQAKIKKFMTDLQGVTKKFKVEFAEVKEKMENGRKDMENDMNTFMKQFQADMNDAKNQLLEKTKEMDGDSKRMQECLESLQKVSQKNMEASANLVLSDCLDTDPEEQVAKMNKDLMKFFDSVSKTSTRGQLLGQIMTRCLGSGDIFCTAGQNAFKQNLKDLDAQGRQQLQDLQQEMKKQEKKMQLCLDSFFKTQSGGQKDFFEEAEKCFAKNIAANPLAKL